MRVKIGNQWHDSRDEPICIQVSEGEQLQIAQMDRTVAKNGKFAVFPEDWTTHQAIDWMRDPIDPEPQA
ncbi:hypothetical protein [Billgrantia gudaonensis]|uniref:Uncharacterized protein n=1 Tax=Billgrantia gudaonensis TaxID=376427 RepID=A0A1G8XHV8_9GAMM|nr:hypothetical protein [Halomonas gudaonensis]SDJ89360.1 hypothetical protein SAMN04487954_10926 [Halomonas gudaonensis]